MKVAMVFPSGHLTSTPCIPSLAILLAKNGIKVDIYTAENKTTTTGDSFSIFKGIENMKLYIYPVISKGFWENITLLLLGFFPWWIIKSFRKRYDFIIAIGVRALFIVGIYSLFTSSKYVYLSLELYIKKEMNSIKGRVFKYLESFFNKRASFSIIQDEQRAKILQWENGVKLEDILIFPNSPLPLNVINKIKTYSINTIEKYGLTGKKIVLYAGSIFARWAMTKELIGEAINWPDDWALLIHSRAKLSEIKRFVPEGYDIKNGKVVFSLEPLNEKEYEHLVKASHVGIALYDGKLSKNLYYVGYSSGKVAQYLKYGKPIIVGNLPLLNELTKKYNCGHSINELSEIREVLNEIFARYDYYSDGAKRAFREVLNPEIYTEAILKRLLSDKNL